MSNRPKRTDGQPAPLILRPGETWMHNTVLVSVPSEQSMADARQVSHDQLYDATDRGRTMRRPPGVHWTFHQGLQPIIDAAMSIYGPDEDGEQDAEGAGIVAAISMAAAEYPGAILVCAHCVCRYADPKSN